MTTTRRLVGSDARGDRPFFPGCLNGNSDWRFMLVVFCAWLFTLRALSKLASRVGRVPPSARVERVDRAPSARVEGKPGNALGARRGGCYVL